MTQISDLAKSLRLRICVTLGSVAVVALFLICFLAAGFVSAQKEVSFDADSLGLRCRELSKHGNYHYQVVSGVVLRAGIVPSDPGDCDGGCTQHLKTWFFSVMQPLTKAGSNNKFTVYTTPETKTLLLVKKPYMKAGKRYAFCARGPEEGTETVYRLDVVETIQELK